MKITNIEVIPVGEKLDEPLWWGAFGISIRGAVLIRISTDEGITGWGEAGYAYKFAKRIKDVIEEIKSEIIGEDPLYIERIWNKVYNPTHLWGKRGINTYALSGIDIALWDIKGKVAGLPIFKLLGGDKNIIKAYSAPSLKEPSVFKKECEKIMEQGFKAIKVRLGIDPKTDLELVRIARETIGDNVELMVDGNMAYDFKTAIKMAKELEKYNILWFEEPIKVHTQEQYINEYTKFNPLISMKLAGGEQFFTRYEFQGLLANKAVDIVQPDCTGVGGITEGKKIADMASVYGIYCVPCVACSSIATIGLAANLHLVGSISNTMYIEYDAYESNIRKEMAIEPIYAENGFVKIPDGPGLGLEINEKMIEKYTLA